MYFNQNTSGCFTTVYESITINTGVAFVSEITFLFSFLNNLVQTIISYETANASVGVYVCVYTTCIRLQWPRNRSIIQQLVGVFEYLLLDDSQNIRFAYL